MSIDARRAETLRALESTARKMGSDVHVSYLNELAGALRAQEGDVVVDALRLLAAMKGSGYAPRRNQLAAINDVGAWCEARVLREPAIAADQLAFEVGWLKRLAKYYRESGEVAPMRPSGQAAEVRFGARVDEIEQARRRANDSASRRPTRKADRTSRGEMRLSSGEPRPRSEPSGVPEPPRPALTELPAEFLARFDKFSEARDAWKHHKDRRKRNRPLNDRALPIHPVDERLAHLAKGFVVSTIRTEGVDEYFERVAANAGSELLFRVSHVEQTLVRRILPGAAV